VSHLEHPIQHSGILGTTLNRGNSLGLFLDCVALKKSMLKINDPNYWKAEYFDKDIAS
jgi:hypothetical protein